MIDTLLLLAGLVLLIFGGNWLVKGASALAAFLGVSNFIIGLTVVAMGTSAPEASLAVLSSMMGEPTISFGGVIGSNMVNIGVVLAITCLFNPLTVRLALLRREVLFLVVSILTIAVLGIDGNIDVGNSLVLIAAWLAFLYFIARSAWTEREARRIGAPAEALIMERWQAVVLTVAGLVALIAGSELVIDGGVGLAEDLGVDEFIIGVTMVAVGTSIPELVVGLTSLRQGETGLLLGNILGSNIYNSLLIVGLAGLFSPILIPNDFYVLVLPATLVMYGILIGFIYTKGKIDRRTSLMLIGVYISYLILLFI